MPVFTWSGTGQQRHVRIFNAMERWAESNEQSVNIMYLISSDCQSSNANPFFFSFFWGARAECTPVWIRPWILGLSLSLSLVLIPNLIYKEKYFFHNVQYVAKSIAICKKNPYIINQNHFFSKNDCEVISG
jgi:hypothetical protein